MLNEVQFDLMASSIAMKMAKEMQLPYFMLRRIVVTAPHRYKHYSIPKRSNPQKVRHIAQPAREVKSLQRWLVQTVLSGFPVHQAAHAYEKDSSIRKNAEKHSQNSYLLKMDFKDFFPSITPVDFLNVVSEKIELNEHDRYFLQQILFHRSQEFFGLVLSVGAPSSPKISNIVMYDFDEKLTRYCKENGVSYTRYADDITFSTNEMNILKDCERFVVSLCNDTHSPNLCVNEDKTVHTSKKRSRRVTGLVLSNEGRVSLGRDRKRIIRAALHNYKCENLQNGEELNQLRGWLAFAKDAEPGFLERLSNKYSTEIKTLLGVGLEG